ncbi:hypothetical protein QNN00_16275 [Bacillus velezensis]|nr:hypothetical protein [Bacillus velezensis]
MAREQAVEMSAMAAQNKLHFSLSYPPSRFRKETMEQLRKLYSNICVILWRTAQAKRKQKKPLVILATRNVNI